MKDKKFKAKKKGLPGGFFFLIGFFIVMIIEVQNLSGNKASPVSFPYQLEHLINLSLLESEESKKVALNESLVTFSGRFKEQLTEESSKRFRYLELLERHHQLKAEQEICRRSISNQKPQVLKVVDRFLQLTGLSIPSQGYVILKGKENNFLVLNELSPASTETLSLKEIKKEWKELQISPQVLVEKLHSWLREFRSPILGIGNEGIKQRLKEVQQTLNENQTSYIPIFKNLEEIISQLENFQEDARLLSLRAVRGYKELVDQESSIQEAIENNNQLLQKARRDVSSVSWFFNNRELSSRALENQDPEAFEQWFAAAKKEWQQFAVNKGSSFKSPDQTRTAVLEKNFKSEEPSQNYFGYFLTILPVIAVILFLYFIFSRQMKGMGAGAMTFGKAPVRLLSKDQHKISFKDVAGCDEAKEELQEIVDFLKDPSKFTALGARIPKGVLLIGAPGTGKTLIAKAVAGEADRPFFSISGSDFVEMFVGVGASRIRDLFEQARKQAPCIIFMDEIDAVGRHRGAGIGGGHDEREQTLNQLLVEMDGFDTSEGIILIAATNRPDVLDKALLRPGRFDRRITIDLPDVKGRHEILKVHARKIKLDGSVDLSLIARTTPGASGADLANILNEAALLAARKGRTAVAASDVAEASDKVRYGKERRSLEMDQQEKKTTAYHEAGHAVVAFCLQYADPIDKVTIIPRGLSLGATHFMPKKNRLSYWKKELLDQLAVLMGGRVAEELFVGDASSGAQMDIVQATRLGRSMVCEWGMTDLGIIAYDERSESGAYLGLPNYHEKNYSDATAQHIDATVHKLMDEAYLRAQEIIQANRGPLQLLVDMLMEFETLYAEDLVEIFNGSWSVDKKKERVKKNEELHRPPAPLSSPVAIPPTSDQMPQTV
jgi:cell division protease FtsH